MRKHNESQMEVLPPEHKRIKDPVTGVDLLFITTDPAKDLNLYFHERSWLADETMVLFNSSRERGGLMGYLFATGELVRLTTPKGGMGSTTAARSRNSVFVARGQEILELALEIKPSKDPARNPSEVIALERVICTLPQEMMSVSSITENSDGSLLATGVRWQSGEMGIITIHPRTGKIRVLFRMEPFGGHVQFSRTSPHLLSFAGRTERLMVVDVRKGTPRAIYKQAQGELVTHECWWINDQLTFCGGHREGESHVKVIEVHTGRVWIVGAGAWWSGGTPAEYAKWNWWHAAGHESGRWVAADNWHGDIVLFDGKTTRMHQLTLGHRTYGGGDHPHVGWDRRGERVVFASNMLGDMNVCVATIPKEW